MKIADLQVIGFVPSKLVKREIPIKHPKPLPKTEWADKEIPEFSETETVEDTLTIWIRKGSAADAIEVMQSTRREQPFVAIYNSIRHEDGERVFASIEQAETLQLWLALPMFEAIREVAGNGPKSSRKAKSSGSKPASPTESPKQNSSTD